MPGPPRRRVEASDPTPPAAVATGSCAVVVAAWKAARYILEALESIDAQQPRPGWTYELRVGVDGCEETSRFLLRAARPHMFSQANVGPYVMRNSLIELAPASAYAVFDADDVMRPEYLTTLLDWTGAHGIAGGARTQMDEHGRILNRRVGYRGGVGIISAEAWGKLGGYRAWPMAADHDLVLRARAMKIPVIPVNKALYHRRVHPSALTQRPDTGFKSSIRRDFGNRARRLTREGRGLYVHPATTPLELRTP